LELPSARAIQPAASIPSAQLSPRKGMMLAVATASTTEIARSASITRLCIVSARCSEEH
jgi:hypothetical protein